MIFFVSFSSNSGRHNSATKDFSSARDKRIEILFYEESFVTLHSHHAIMAIYSGGSRGRVGGPPPPPIRADAFLGLKFLHRQDCLSLFNWPRNYHMQPRLEVTAMLLYLPTFSESCKCVRFSSCHDRISDDFPKTSELNGKCPKMFRQLLSTSEAIQKTTILTCFHFIRTQSHLLAPFWNIFEEIELNFRY